jgi:hypothetical protein
MDLDEFSYACCYLTTNCIIATCASKTMQELEIVRAHYWGRKNGLLTQLQKALTDSIKRDAK